MNPENMLNISAKNRRVVGKHLTGRNLFKSRSKEKRERNPVPASTRTLGNSS